MPTYELTEQELAHRKEIADRARKMVLTQIPVEDQDGISLTLGYLGYYMQLSFSPLHPLMVIYLAKALAHPGGTGKKKLTNELNLRSVLGSHAINEEVGCYSYRAVHWLDTELTPERFFEILDRCVEEASRGYARLVS